MTDDIKKAKLPTEGMTVELWAWDEQFIEWGGYIVAVQDNGAFEKRVVARHPMESVQLCTAPQTGLMMAMAS